MLIKTKDGEWYVCEIRGAVFISWVCKRNANHALVFPETGAEEWRLLMEKMTGKELVLERI